MAAINAGHDIALANKETLVTGGHLVMAAAKEKGVKIYPVDSEHSAIFQSLQGKNENNSFKIILTASGGPFFGKTRKELDNITPADALKHPNWNMGQKIPIDSATLMNKGLEVIEAVHLFGVSPKDIEVVVHRQSILHSAVEFEDGAVIGQFGTPDMAIPIQYALTYPDRMESPAVKLSLTEVGSLTFEKPDMETFTGLKLALRAAGEGGSVPTVFNAANEKAVSLFLNRKIRFLEIPESIEMCMDAHGKVENPDVEQILTAERETYELIQSRYN